MKLGFLIGAWSGAQFRLPLERIRLVEELGYDSVWSSEAYGADALSPLAYLAAVTDRIKLGTAVVQISAPHAGRHRHGVRDHRGDGGPAGA